MNEDDRAALLKTYELVTENNKMLRAMRRSMWYGRLAKLAYLGVIIALSLMAYYVLQPYLDEAKSLYETTTSLNDKFSF